MDLTKCHGRRFSAEIKGVYCEGVIDVEDGNVYLCQNKIRGSFYKNKFGYDFSYFFERYLDSCYHTVKNFKLIDRTIEDVEVGDIVNDGSGNRKVLAKLNNCVLLSIKELYDTACDWCTIEELKDCDYILVEKNDTPTRKITHAEIAEKFGVEVGKFEVVG